MQIVDAISRVNQQVNLIGVAIETCLPKSTKGTDYFCSVRIVDESWPSGVRIHFFAETMENLPLIQSVGNIVLVTRVVMKLIPLVEGEDKDKDKNKNKNVYALYNKKFSSFALFEGRGSSIKELVPFQVSPLYQPRYTDSEFIMLLRKWTLSVENEDMSNSLLLRDIKQDERVNLLCKILHVAQFKEDEWMIFVWDGTDAPPASVEAEFENEMMGTPLPLVLEPTPLSRDILCTFPTAGTVLRMSVDQCQAKLGIKFLRANRWVKFIYVRCEAQDSLWRAVLTPFSKLCYLPDDEEFVKLRQRFHAERIEAKWGKMPLTSLPWPSGVTETDHPDVAFSTLMDVLTYPEVTCKFKCVVRVVAIGPWSTELFRSPEGVYRIRVTLEDPTARIHAYIYAEDGVKFFGTNLSADVLAKKRNWLLGVAPGQEDTENVSRNPPWIQCCLYSYYTRENDVWGSRKYRIFDTTCVG